MTTEEKAKAYDEALERARKIHDEIVNNEVIGFPGQITDIFPELRESEDERIRKIITDSVFLAHGANDEYRDVLDYLDRCGIEKQKEEEGYEAIPVESTLEYKLGFKAGKESEKQKEQKPVGSYEIVPYIDDKIAELQDMWREEGVAFDWDDMKDMIEDVARHFFHKEPKPVECVTDAEMKKGWDELTKFKHFASALSDMYNIIPSHSSLRPKDIDWNNFCAGLLTYLKRNQPVEWSEEDEEIFNNIIEKAKGGHWIEVNEITWLINRFKLLRPKPKWVRSEEDYHWEGVIQLLRDYQKTIDRESNNMAYEAVEDYIEWIKSHQPHWKPSEEQMEALLNTLHPDDPYYIDLKSLYEQLKKL